MISANEDPIEKKIKRWTRMDFRPNDATLSCSQIIVYGVIGVASAVFLTGLISEGKKQNKLKSEERVEYILEKYDTNRDGVLDTQELSNLLGELK